MTAFSFFTRRKKHERKTNILQTLHILNPLSFYGQNRSLRKFVYRFCLNGKPDLVSIPGYIGVNICISVALFDYKINSSVKLVENYFLYWMERHIRICTKKSSLLFSDLQRLKVNLKKIFILYL